MKNAMKTLAFGTVTLAALAANAKIQCAVQAETAKMEYTTVLGQADFEKGDGKPVYIETNRIFTASIDHEGRVTLAVSDYANNVSALATGNIKSGWVQLLVPGRSLMCREI